jgi:hypothetical protein
MADVASDVLTDTPATTESTPSAPASVPSSPTSASPDIRGETEAVFKEMAGAGSPPDAPRETPPPAQPATQADGLAATPAPTGYIPLDRHQAVLTKQRNEAQAQFAEFQRKVAWAEKLSPQDQRKVQWLLEDPASALAYLQQEQARRQPAAPPEDPEPQADVELHDGSRFYSAPQQQKWAEWRERRLEQRLTGQFAPILQQIALERLQTQANTEATQLREQYHAKFHLFKELEPDIKALCLRDPNLSIPEAYALVYNEKGRAKERESWEAERAGRLQLKAAASTVVPGRAQPSTPKADRDKSARDIVREEFARHASV